jgi:hypothetical protein
MNSRIVSFSKLKDNDPIHDNASSLNLDNLEIALYSSSTEA